VIELEEVVGSYGDDEPTRFIAIADHFLREGDHHAAAAALDRAYGLSPEDVDLARHRAAILDGLALEEHGLIWRYVPAGTFLMGSDDGDPDERPVHPRRLEAFWIADTPLTWAAHNAVLGWEPAPHVGPHAAAAPRDEQFDIRLRFKIRLQYCEGETTRAQDWHAHAGMSGFHPVGRDKPWMPNRYDTKPMIAAWHGEAEHLAAQLSTDRVRYGLPSEAQWEKAARGGLVGKRYAWGDDPPTRELCDFDRMGDFRLGDPHALPPNGYGVFGMCGGVSELTSTIYDALAYRGGEPSVPDEPAYVVRGGSFVDCADAVTVSYRTSRGRNGRPTPTIGMRLVREAR
jgi:formylglycine-generating enzyme